jgi:hypothetical protein
LGQASSFNAQYFRQVILFKDLQHQLSLLLLSTHHSNNTMRLGISITTAVVLLLNQANAFTPQNTPSIRFRRSQQDASAIFVSMTAEAEPETTSLVQDYASVNALTYRQLQIECKARSLAATGNTAALRCRLLEHLGIMKVDDQDECDIADEVGFLLLCS